MYDSVWCKTSVQKVSRLYYWKLRHTWKAQWACTCRISLLLKKHICVWAALVEQYKSVWHEEPLWKCGQYCRGYPVVFKGVAKSFLPSKLDHYFEILHTWLLITINILHSIKYSRENLNILRITTILLHIKILPASASHRCWVGLPTCNFWFIVCCHCSYKHCFIRKTSPMNSLYFI